MANGFIASDHPLVDRPRWAVAFFSASQINVVAAASFGRWPGVLMILSSLALTLSIALVV